jgi:transcriptional regulator with XRE-family HTH domain
MDTSDFNRRIGALLRRRRRELGLSQKQVAQAVGVTFQQIQKYETGVGLLASRLWELSRAVEVGVGYFFDGLERPPTREAQVRSSRLRPRDEP